MNIVYTFHAEEQIIERRIVKEWVNEVIKRPDRMKKIGSKRIVSKRLNSHILEVVYFRRCSQLL